MDWKKVAFSDQLLSSPGRKVVSRFGLGIVLSFIVMSLVLFDFPSKGPFLNPVFQGLNRFGSKSNTSVLSWPFFSTSVSNSSHTTAIDDNDTSIVKKLPHSVALNETLVPNVAPSNKSLDSVDSDGKDSIFDDAQLGNVSENYKNVSFAGGEGSVGVNNNEIMRSENQKNASLPGAGGKGGVGVNTDEIKGSENKKNESWLDAGGKGMDVGNIPVGDSVANAKNESVGFKENSEGGRVGNYTNDGDNGHSSIERSRIPVVSKRFDEDCDIFNGRWVRDDTKPHYPAGSCPYIDRDFDCHLNGRPDSEYVKWRWQSYDCDIPRLNTTDFLERLRGKKLVFVGDSLNRNMWESLVCVLRQGVQDKNRVYEISGRHEFKKKGFYAFRFEDYNCSVDFVSSPFLVKESSFKGENGTFETLRLDLMDGTTSMYHDANVLIFNTGHWWTHEKTSLGENYYQEGSLIHPRLKVLEAFKRALTTWARWVDKNIDRTRTQVIFRGYSVTHFRGGPWNAGGQCQAETEPIFNEAYLTKYSSKMKILEYVLKDMKTPVTYLNISRLTDYRKDGHPSVYRPDYRSPQQLVTDHPQDCSHWCLPGVPDTWNELLYVALLKSWRGLEKH